CLDVCRKIPTVLITTSTPSTAAFHASGCSALLKSSGMAAAPAAAGHRALGSGSYAGIASGLALLAGGVRDCRSAIAPVNAVSHWIWDEKALRQRDGSIRYSVAG